MRYEGSREVTWQMVMMSPVLVEKHRKKFSCSCNYNPVLKNLAPSYLEV